MILLKPVTGHFVGTEFAWAFDRSYLRFESNGNALPVQVAIPQPGKVDALVSELRSVRERQLAHIPISRIVKVIGEVAKRWLKPDYHLRQFSERALPFTTRLSSPMVSTLIDGMFEALMEDSVWHLLVEELGDPLVLDSFRPRPSAHGLTRAYGPEVLVNIFGGGNPLLAALDISCALLTKTAFVGRVSSQEPLFASVFAQSIAEVDEELAAALIICWWPRETDQVSFKLLKRADYVIVSGTDATVRAISSVVPDRQRVISHDPRIGVALVGRGALDQDQVADLAQRAAADVSLADQLTCLSPQVLYVEKGGEVSPVMFAERLAGELLRLQSMLPRGRVPLEAILSFNRTKARYQFRQYDSASEVTVFGLEKTAEWLVVYDPQPVLMPGPGLRTIRVCPIESLEVAVDMIREHKPLVSTVGLAVESERLASLTEQLGSSGATRICRIGRMLKPPLTWHADGSFRLSPILKWIDLELSQ